jgi:hypothetical protein
LDAIEHDFTISKEASATGLGLQISHLTAELETDYPLQRQVLENKKLLYAKKTSISRKFLPSNTLTSDGTMKD